MSIELAEGGPKDNLESPLKGKTGEHKLSEKRKTIRGELEVRMQSLFDQLPQHSKIVLAREIRLAGDNPEQAVERLEREISIRSEIVNHIKHSGDPKAALKEVQEIIPEETIQ